MDRMLIALFFFLLSPPDCAYVNEQDLKEHALTKQMARLQTREDILRRKQIAQSAPDEDSDAEEQAAKAKSAAASASSSSGAATSPADEMENLLDVGEKVKLEDFELLKVLGRGSFGKVMQVRKKSDGKIYAMKILKKRAIIARNQVEHTKAERKILQSLQHPFLMTLRYAFQSKEKLYFVLVRQHEGHQNECVERTLALGVLLNTFLLLSISHLQDYYQGGELFFHLKNNRRFSEEVAKIYVGEIALALGHLHSLQIIYRDLKPENILLDDKGHVCLTDFGLSKDVDPQDKAHTCQLLELLHRCCGCFVRMAHLRWFRCMVSPFQSAVRRSTSRPRSSRARGTIRPSTGGRSVSCCTS